MADADLDKNDKTNIESDIEKKEKSAQFLWTGFVILFFVVQAILWMVAISLTANDKSHAIVEGYDEKALRWDEEKAIRAASDQLGWSAEIIVDPSADVRGFRDMTVEISDSKGERVSNAKVNVNVFHRAYAGDPQMMQATETEEGLYAMQIIANRNGNWQFIGRVERGSDVFLFEETKLLNFDD